MVLILLSFIFLLFPFLFFLIVCSSAVIVNVSGPENYCKVRKLKKDLRDRKFDDDEEVKSAVMEHFADKDPEYFLKGIEMLVHRCEKCDEVKGDYIEK